MVVRCRDKVDGPCGAAGKEYFEKWTKLHYLDLLNLPRDDKLGCLCTLDRNSPPSSPSFFSLSSQFQRGRTEPRTRLPMSIYIVSFHHTNPHVEIPVAVEVNNLTPAQKNSPNHPLRRPSIPPLLRAPGPIRLALLLHLAPRRHQHPARRVLPRRLAPARHREHAGAPRRRGGRWMPGRADGVRRRRRQIHYL